MDLSLLLGNLAHDLSLAAAGLVAGLLLYALGKLSQITDVESFISYRDGRYHVIYENSSRQEVSLFDATDYRAAADFVFAHGGDAGLRWLADQRTHGHAILPAHKQAGQMTWIS